MINQSQKFLNNDGTVSREWWLFLQTLNASIGGNSTNPANLPSIVEVQDVERFDSDDFPVGVPTIQQYMSNNVMLWMDM